jgi:hemoglobin-like flavoprotein
MSLTSQQIELVQQSFRKVMPISVQAADLFYNKLFELDPAVRHLFKGDMQEQGRKLMQMIAVAVSGLSNLDTLVPAVEDLGRRHVEYGVRPEHYDTVGTALLWTLEQGLGAEFTPPLKEAWASVYTVLAETAIAGVERK